MSIGGDDRDFLKQLSKTITQRYFADVPRSDIRIGELQYHYWSVGLIYEVDLPDCRFGVYVKIPKRRASLRQSAILPLDGEARDMAAVERRSLSHLTRFWLPSSHGVSYVNLLGYLEEFNALVMERVRGPTLCTVLRQWECRRRLGFGGDASLAEGYVNRLGRALARYHGAAKTSEVAGVGTTIEAIAGNAQMLREKGVDDDCLSAIESQARKFAAGGNTSPAAMTVSGLRLLHFFVTDDDRLIGFDPELLRPGVPEDDLARIVADLRGLFWGTPLQALGLEPQSSLETSLLNGWRSVQDFDRSRLSLCLIRQFLENWLAGYEALHFRPWPRIAKSFYRAQYVNAFYRREIARIRVAAPAE